MIHGRKAALRPILESSDGLHLTAYISNTGNLIDLKNQIRKTLDEAYEWLHAVLTPEERKKFLEPIDALLRNGRILNSMKNNIGIFRTMDSFRVLNVPVPLERQCHVASSFHVKPLLRWMQVDHEFLLLGMTESSADLYLGSQSSFQKVDTILFPETIRAETELGDYQSLKAGRQRREKSEAAFVWLSDWIDQVTHKSSPRLFLAGDPVLLARAKKSMRYQNLVHAPAALAYNKSCLPDICENIRRLLRTEAKSTLTRALIEYRFAEDLNLGKRNIFQIAKAATKGRVKKLIVADGMNVYGKVDKRTGGLAIHPFDLDHEDDDLLDDLAQAVLASGGEVVVAPREEIPKGSPILAILERPCSSANDSDDLKFFQTLQERRTI